MRHSLKSDSHPSFSKTTFDKDDKVVTVTYKIRNFCDISSKAKSEPLFMCLDSGNLLYLKQVLVSTYLSENHHQNCTSICKVQQEHFETLSHVMVLLLEIEPWPC
jgi:hypothetical protein